MFVLKHKTINIVIPSLLSFRNNHGVIKLKALPFIYKPCKSLLIYNPRSRWSPSNKKWFSKMVLPITDALSNKHEIFNAQ